MPKPVLYLHIGEPKTGTTAIQTFLLANRLRLKEQGFLYPKTGIHDSAHRKLSPTFYSAMLARNEAPTVMQELLAEVRDAACHTVVLSFEGFCLDHPAALACLAGEFQVKVVYYLRRQDHLFESRYAQHVRSCIIRQIRPPSVVLEEQVFFVDHLRVLHLYAGVFGKDNIIVRVFEPQSLVQKDAVPDFLQVIGLAPSPDFVPSTSSNAALKRPYLAFLRQCNALPLLPDEHLRLELELTALTDQDKTPYVRHLISPRDRQGILDRHAAHNDEIARHWLGRSDGILFREPPPSDSQAWEPPGLVPPATQHAIFDRLSPESQTILRDLHPPARTAPPGDPLLPVLPDDNASALNTLDETRTAAQLTRRITRLAARVKASGLKKSRLPADYIPIMGTNVKACLASAPDSADGRSGFERACSLLPLLADEQRRLADELETLAGTGGPLPGDPLSPDSQHAILARLSQGLQDTLAYLDREIRLRLPGKPFLPVVPADPGALHRLLFKREQARLQRRLGLLERELDILTRKQPPASPWLRFKRLAGRIIRGLGVPLPPRS